VGLWSSRRVDLVAVGAGLALVAAGAAVEVAGGLSLAGALDWAVGVGFTVAAVRRSRVRRGSRLAPELVLGLVTAALWFASTGVHLLPTRWQAAASALTVIAYRGPLLHWLVRQVALPVRGAILALVVVGYAAAFTGTQASAAVTAAAALALAVAVVATGRSRQDDARRQARTTAAVLAALGLVWAGLAAGVVAAAGRQLLDAAVLLVAAALLAWPASSRGLSGAVGGLVVELGPSGREGSPVSATLARALADPLLELRVYAPDSGWTDEYGRPVQDPVDEAADRVTVAHAPDGGRVALVHHDARSAGVPLARAAAAAALIALESVRWEVQVRREAEAVRESTARLVTVDDEERRSLAERLHSGPLTRLADLRHALSRDGDELAPLAEELDRVMIELDHLAAGLDPGGIGTDGLSGALTRLCDGMAVPVEHHVNPAVDGLPAELAALTYFVTAEALTNAARHAAATRITVALDVTEHELRLTIEDDGRGGAVVEPGRGVQGLRDRVELAGGRFTLDSPPGGPTRLLASVPRPSAPVDDRP
jgi:signal transduction histidine kinase